MHSIPAYARRMLKLGAMGYVTKNLSKEEMLKAIIEVDEGKKYFCEEVMNILAQQELEENNHKPDMNILSRREIDVVKLITEGLFFKRDCPGSRYFPENRRNAPL